MRIVNDYFDYEMKVKTVKANNLTSINKTNTHLLHQITKYK